MRPRAPAPARRAYPLADLFAYAFLRDALIAGTIVAIMAGTTGTLLVLRGQSFAGHALGHVGFTGAALALLLGVAPLAGLVAITVAAGIAIGLLGPRADERDVAIGIVLSVSLGAGLLFLSLLNGPASQATALLFGSILGVDPATLTALAILAAITLAALAAIARPLLFLTLQPELAEAQGVRPRLIATLFMATVALTVAACVQVVGALLVFALLVAPAAAAQRICTCLAPAALLAVALAIGQVWGALLLATLTDWPVSFWVTLLGGAAYAIACMSRP